MTRSQAAHRLGVDAAASPDEIRKAYRAALKRAHPDLGGTDEELRTIVEAYETLCAEPAPEAPAAQAPAYTAAPARLEITPVIAMAGGRITTRLPDGRRVTVSLKPGLRQGDTVKVGGAPMSVTIKGRRELFVSGDDLCMLVKTSAAVLQEGGRITVKTPSGVRSVWAPRQDGPDPVVRIAGQGLPSTARHAQGDLILKLVPEGGPKDSRVRERLKKFTGDWAA